MDIQQHIRSQLEPIQEESEQEDEIRGSKIGEGEEDFQIQGVEAEEVMTEDENEEEGEEREEEEEEDDDDDTLLRVMRPRRKSCSRSQESFLQMRSTNDHQEKMENLSEPDWSTNAVDLSDEATPLNLGLEKRSSSGELRINVSKIRQQIHLPPKASVQKKTNRRTREMLKTSTPVVDQFPQWLVDLMVNIEEATTHQLAVE